MFRFILQISPSLHSNDTLVLKKMNILKKKTFKCVKNYIKFLNVKQTNSLHMNYSSIKLIIKGIILN